MDNEIEKLIQAFSKDIPKRASDLTVALNAVIAALEQNAPPRWDELEYHVHKLAGVSGTYGFMPLSAICAYLEDLIGGPEFKTLPTGVSSEHLKRWNTIFNEQWQLAAARKKPFETPEQLVGALSQHLTSLTGVAA